MSNYLASETEVYSSTWLVTVAVALAAMAVVGTETVRARLIAVCGTLVNVATVLNVNVHAIEVAGVTGAVDGRVSLMWNQAADPCRFQVQREAHP